MRQRFTNRLSFANVISAMALFVSLSGVAYAGGGLDLVTGKGIENGSITGEDIAENAIAGKQVKEDKLKGLDECPGSTPIDIGDICVGPVQPALTWEGALKSCVFNNLRLPDSERSDARRRRCPDPDDVHLVLGLRGRAGQPGGIHERGRQDLAGPDVRRQAVDRPRCRTGAWGRRKS